MLRRIAVFFIGFLIVGVNAFAYENALWVPGWGSAQLSSIQLNAGALTETNPVWYAWNADGSIRKKTNAENPTWRAAMTGTRILPSIQNTTANGFDGTAILTMLSSATNREAHANAITQLTVAQAYDGIDIDYESVPTSARANFTAFMATLSEKLHAANKQLSIAVHPKTGEGDNWDGPGSQDWNALGRIVDSVKIMAYDYHWSTSAAGAITPLDWLDKVATYAESTIPPKKIMMGLPFYGYDWNGNNGADVSYASAMQLAQANGVAVTRDVNGEATFRYGTHTVYFQDASSYQKKVDMLKQKHPSIGGFAAWAAGQEDPDVWKVIRGMSSNSGVTPVAGDFVVAGPTAVTVRQGSNATASFNIVPVNGFNASAAVTVTPVGSFNGSLTANVASVAPNGTVTVTVSTTLATAAGNYQFKVRFASGTLVHEQTVSVAVTGVGRRRAVR